MAFRYSTFLILLGTLEFQPASVWPQRFAYAISGTILDPSGALIPGAHVALVKEGGTSIASTCPVAVHFKVWAQPLQVDRIRREPCKRRHLPESASGAELGNVRRIAELSFSPDVRYDHASDVGRAGTQRGSSYMEAKPKR
jgi:hypothetical protein